VAKSFGLREAPNQIVGNELKLFKTNHGNGFSNKKFDAKKNASLNKNKKDFEDDDYDRLASKYARDMKRLTNNHREYGNVVKKNKLRSQKVDIDLRFSLYLFY
jgi:hypothetical protein